MARLSIQGAARQPSKIDVVNVKYANDIDISILFTTHFWLNAIPYFARSDQILRFSCG